MEVIRHGKKYAITVCTACECEFRFVETEIKHKQEEAEDAGYYTIFDYVDCPECDHDIVLCERVIEI